MRHNGKINLSQFENAYLLVIGSACRAAQYGYPTLYALLRAIPCTVSVKEVRHRKKVVQLNKKLAAVGLLPPTYTSASPLQDTDSSNDSIENESSSTLNVSNTTFGMTADDSAKWEASSNSSRQFPWNEDPVNWEKKATHWALSGTDETQKWRDPEESFNVPMPPMPDSAWPTVSVSCLVLFLNVYHAKLMPFQFGNYRLLKVRTAVSGGHPFGLLPRDGTLTKIRILQKWK